MAAKRHSVEQMIGRLREVEVALARGELLADVLRRLGITEQTYHRWRDECGGSRAAQALRESEQRYRAIVETQTELICRFRPDTTLTFVNRAYARYFGQRPEELIGRSVLSAVPVGDQGLVKAHLDALGREKRLATFEHRVVAGTGELRWQQRTDTAILDDDGMVIELQSVGRDVTDRRLAEDELRKFKTLTDRASYGAAISDLDGNLLYVNHNFAAMHGYRPSELVDRHLSVFHTPEQMPVVNELNERLRREGGYTAKEVWHKRRDGSVFPALMNATVIKDGEGAPLFLSATAIDITERKRAEEGLRESSARLQLALQAADVGLFDWDLRTNEVYFSPEWKRQIGYEPDEVSGDYDEWECRLHPDDRDRALSFLKAYLDGARPDYIVEFRLRHKDGSYRWIYARGELQRDVDGRPCRMLGCHVDVTERKLAGEALRESEERYRSVVEDSPSLICRFRPGGEITFVNDAYCNYFGRSRAELIGVNFLMLVPEHDRERVMADISSLTPDSPTHTHEHQVVTPDGGIRWQRWTNRGLFNERGEPIAYQSFGEDITEHHRAEEALRASGERFRLVTEAALDAIYDWDILADRSWRNPRYHELFDPAPDSYGWWAEAIHPDDRSRVEASLADAMEQGGDRWSAEYRFRRSDGDYAHVEDRGFILRDSAKRPVRMIGAMTDITVRRRAEAHALELQADLAHLQRLSSIGELAAGLAHELNQPLGAIVNYADTCARRLRAEDASIDAAVDLVQRISGQAKRAGLVIRRLREFVRKREARPAAVSINHLVQEVVGLVEVEARRRQAAVRVELGEHLPPAYADGIQVEQVLLNLVQNGLEAMVDTPRANRELSIRTAPHGQDMIEVAVSDAGCGLTPEALEQVSEPFYTTKPHGIGMGLSISRTILEAHGGRLWVTPNAARGSTLHFVLPCAGHETPSSR